MRIAKPKAEDWPGFAPQVMRTHGFNPSEEDLRDMIRNVDKNANGAIDFNEFIEMMLKQGENAKKKKLLGTGDI